LAPERGRGAAAAIRPDAVNPHFFSQEMGGEFESLSAETQADADDFLHGIF